MNATERLYLDHAATSWPKDPAVVDAMTQFINDCGAAAGRGSYQSAATAGQLVALARRRVASLVGAPSPDCIAFHCNGTAALNAAIHGIVQPGDHLVCSAAEHNSVLRPLHHLKKTRQIDVTVVPVDRHGRVTVDAMLRAVTDRTRLVAMTHASNVTGALQPVEALGAALKHHGTRFLCDAAQTFGTLPLDVQACNVDLLAAPGHKSSGGPLGTAFLYVAPSLHDELIPSMQGGTGSQSESLEMPETMPDILEAGNLNVPAIAGWEAALEQLETSGLETRRQHAARLAELLYSGLREIEGVTLFGEPRDLPIASLAISGLSPSDTAAILDGQYRIETRAGLHCAALIHHDLGSDPQGTLRISAGHSTTEADLQRAIAAINEIAGAMSSLASGPTDATEHTRH